MSGRFEQKKPPKAGGRKRTVWIVLGVIAVLLLAAVVCMVVYYHSVLDKMNKVVVPTIVYTEPVQETTEAEAPASTAAATEAHIPSSKDYVNILVVGQAAREGETNRFADTAILCTINTYEKTLTMTSMLRDSFVKMPDYRGHTGGRIKLTTIYHLGSIYGDGIPGSMELMNLTLYRNFGIEVDYNFEVDFEAFIDVVDLLGGVEVELTEAEAKYLNKDEVWVRQEVQPGLTRLDGMAALSYTRMRKAEGDNDSDIVRTSRQRKFIEAVLTQLRGKSLSDLQKLVNVVLPKITTSMTNAQITDCLLTMLPMLPELKIETGGTCPASYFGDLVDIYGDGVKHSVLRFNETETKSHMRAITEGETEPTEP